MSLIENTLRAHLPAHKATPQGWLTMNCPVCVSNGQPRPDTRHRGGIRFDLGQVAYHCFNCNFTTGWRPGSRLGFRMIKLMRGFGIDEGDIQRLKIQLWDQVTEDVADEPVVFQRDWPRYELPWPVTGELTKEADAYLRFRGVRDLAPWLMVAEPTVGMNNRIILPYTYGDDVVGYSARLIGEAENKNTPKMISHRPPAYVFNLDQQGRRRKYTIVVEGEYDALSVGGVAIMTNSIHPDQARLIEDLDSDPILVADRDPSGRRMVEQAIELGWSVSFPDWPADIKDANEAAQRFGRAATLQSILMAVEYSPLKIKLLMRRWF